MAAYFVLLTSFVTSAWLIGLNVCAVSTAWSTRSSDSIG